MRIEIAIPTLGRMEKLLKCLGSIDEAKKQIEDRLYVYLYFSSELEYKLIDESLKHYPYIFTRLIDSYNAAEFWNNHIKEHNADIFYYLNDDVLLAPNCLKNSINTMISKYPDLDGVIGIKQEGFGDIKTMPTAFGAIGSKFIDRFPNRKVMCEDFKRLYLDEELYLYTSSINKFYLDKTASLLHCHPCLNKKYEDKTHYDVRKYLKEDKKSFEERRRLNYLWGKNYNLINENFNRRN